MKTNLYSVLAVVTLCGTLGYIKARPHVNRTPVVNSHGKSADSKIIRGAKVITVLISGEGFGPSSRGTGILIDSRHVLTCAHVALNGSDETWVYFYPGYFVARGKVVYASRSKDLAILELNVEAKTDKYATFQEKHADGDPITVIGNALGSMKWFVSWGVISGESIRDLYTDAVVNGGNSGGPWINDKGEIVALTDWGMQDGKGNDLRISGGVSAKTINEFLAAWKNPSILDLLGAL